VKARPSRKRDWRKKSKMSCKQVYFIGTLPAKGKTPFGGGEVGNLRTVRMLESFGYRVRTIRRYRSQASETRLQVWVMYPLRFLANVLACFTVLLLGKRRGSVVHVSGFYGPTIPIETVQVFLAKSLGYRLVYEMRGGGAQHYYENLRNGYRWQFRRIVRKADGILSQGKENEALLKSLCDTPVYHYPNAVSADFYPALRPEKPADRVNLLFYGRIEVEKNPLLIVEAASLLQRQFDNVTLTLIGSGQRELTARLREKMEAELAPGSFRFEPGCAHEALPPLLADKHFYLFPSRQLREGQSNALTEAMSFGIVPIASPQGFNRSTVGDDALIVETLSAEAYAEAVARILREGAFERYSEQVYARFCDLFTEEAVFARMRKVYDEILPL